MEMKPKKIEAKDFIDTLTKAVVFKESIVTQLQPLDIFYLAEASHHNYYNQNKEQAYCNFTITPKIEKYSNFLQINLNQINE